GIYAGIVLLIRGRHLEASKWWSRMRRPRAGDERSSCTRAAPGLRPGSLGTPARSWLTAGRCGLPEARKERLTRKAPRALSWRQDKTDPESAARRRSENAAMARREAPRVRKGTCTDCNDAPLGAPSPRFLRGQGREDGVPRAAKEQGRCRTPA